VTLRRSGVNGRDVAWSVAGPRAPGRSGFARNSAASASVLSAEFDGGRVEPGARRTFGETARQAEPILIRIGKGFS
jgi:hypothetical protein